MEDDSLLRESRSLMLQDFGCSVAEDADEEISVAVKSGDRGDPVFADVDIPGVLDVNGLAAWLAAWFTHSDAGPLGGYLAK